ncbi:hypothetical protein [uncultured Clostridium sp.]|uniref:hypothetical protein n=1 Tax=uncultured Clostridium sp. TaxID=59620 RepID=UPI003217F2E3
MLDKIFKLFITGEREKREGSTLYYGMASNSDLFYSKCKECGFDNVEFNYYQVALFNDELLSTISYTEGDVYLEVFETKESYLEGKEKFIKWYKENC